MLPLAIPVFALPRMCLPVGVARSISAPVGDWLKGAVNNEDDVFIVQELLEHAARVLNRPAYDPKGMDGRIAKPPKSSNTVKAIRAFQNAFMRRPDGLVDPGGRTFARLNELIVNPPKPVATPQWVEIARNEIGTSEKGGLNANNPRILEYIHSFPYLQDIPYKVKDKATKKRVDSGKMMSEVDETPWCACFVNWCLKKAGQYPGPNAAAKSWLEYGSKLDTPRVGAITIVYHIPGKSTAGTTSSGFHVAFYTGGVGNSITLLGGNQGNTVSEKTSHGYWTVQGFRWPI